MIVLGFQKVPLFMENSLEKTPFFRENEEIFLHEKHPFFRENEEISFHVTTLFIHLTVWVLYFSGRRFVGSSENAWIPASLSLLHKITPYSQKRGVCPPKRPLFFNFMVLVESPKHPPFSMKIRTIMGSRLCGEWRYRAPWSLVCV